jgi:alpha-L-rhamnosidase
MKRIAFLIILGFVAALRAAFPQITATHLQCEYLTNPIAIDIQSPRFFWQVESDARNQRQSAYRIIVATSVENLERNLGDAFDSKRVKSGQTTQIEYKGKELLPAQNYWWKVMVWDQNGKTQGWSEGAFFGTGLLKPQDWKGAQWIAWRPQKEWETEWWRKKDVEMQCLEFGLPSWFGQRFTLWELYNFHNEHPYDPAPLFRKEFAADKKVQEARIFISGLGYYELSINGKRVGDQVLNPGWTNYKKTILYDVHDVTKLIREGENAIGVMLGRGNYGCMAVDHWDFYKKGGFIGQPKLMCRLQIQFEDGTLKDIVSDLSWTVTGGPVVFDDPRMGEIYDARKEIRAWDEPGKPGGFWEKVNPAPAPGGEMKAQLCQPIRVVQRLKPIRLEKRESGWWIDAGTNMSGWLRVRFNGKPGEKILIFYGEKPVVKTLDQPSQFQQMACILKGGEEEFAECRFSYKGFRYALITGYSGTLTAEDIDVCQVNSDVFPVGKFNCSDTTINGIHRISQKAMISNLHSIPTDCPHREKNGWLGDAVTGMEFGMANFDLAALMTKFTRDIVDTQDSAGRLSIIAPDNNYCTGLSPLWSSAVVHVPWYMWIYYGDKRLFEQNWNPIKAWVQSVWTYNQVKGMPGIFNDVLSDWNSPYGNNSLEGGEVYSSMNFYQVLKRLETMAVVLNKREDAVSFASQAKKVKDGVNRWCFDSVNVLYHGLKPTDYRQGPNAMALKYGIVPDRYREKILIGLQESLMKTHDFHIYGGVFTVHTLYELLPHIGKSELAFKLAIQDTYPSFGFMLKNGATTLWEAWADESSHIHHFFGSIDNFFYRYLAGININENAPGFSSILITPHFVKQLNYASASYQSIHGLVSSAWKRSNGTDYTLDIKIPANCTAEIILPDSVSEVKMNGQKVWTKNNRVITPSGDYRLEIKL